MKKWTFAIGNPPYQESRPDTKDMPVYHNFMDAVQDISDKIEFITPGRFLFNAGATPKSWNEKVLNDEHFKVLYYQMDSKKVFPGKDIKGGIAIHYHDAEKEYMPIETFTPYEILNDIQEKIKSIPGSVSLNTIMYPYSTYTLSEYLFKDYPQLVPTGNKETDILSNRKIITTNIFDLLSDLFFEDKPNDGEDYVCLLGRQNGERKYKWIKEKYISVGDNYSKWKVIIPTSNGCGALGEVLSTPLIGTPLIGYTQTFLGIGALDTENEAASLYKYICSKFARTCLGILKITQHNPPEKWHHVPLQDFTASSDIDWSQSIADIDKQLYKKYGLNQQEIDFIEQHVKEMK